MKIIRTLAGLAVLAALAACGGPSNGTPKATMLSPEGANQLNPVFSPDGKRVAYWDQPGQNTSRFLKVAAANDLSGARVLDSVSSGGAAGAPLWSPDGRTLAYFAGTNQDIRVAPVAGGSARSLTTSKGFERPIQWYPRGGRLTYIRTGKGGTANDEQIDVATGTTSPILAETRPAIPFWSPDGTKIAYTVFDAGKTTIWVADSTGRNGRQLTTEGFEGLADAPWSPDGSELLYESNRTGFTDIWAVSVTTDSMRQLTRDVRADYGESWSPDGKWVAFLSDRGRQQDIWIVPAAGGIPQRVTDDAAAEGNVQWVPGTSEIGFTTGTVKQGLWAVTLADTSERRVTPDSIRMGAYDLSPDGKTIVFVHVRGGGVNDLDIMPVAGGGPRTLVSNGASNFAPEWSPDGSKVLYVSTKTGNPDVWVVDTAGGAPKDLTPWPTGESNATWAKDGASIYFESDRDAKPLSDLWEVSADSGAARHLTHTGNIQGVLVSRTSGDVFVLKFGGSEGQRVLSRLLPDGKLETLWDRSSVVLVTKRYITPSGDSIAFFVPGAKGGRQQMLMSTRGGPARPLLPEDAGISGWAPDGRTAIAFRANKDSLYLFSRSGGTMRPLVNNSVGTVRFLPDGKTFLHVRTRTERRIATVDVSALMAKEK